MTLTLDPPDAPATEHTVREAVAEARIAADDIQEGTLCPRCWQVAPPGDPTACATCHAPRPPAGWPPMPYRHNDRYRFNRLLGRGAMGAVFLAIDGATPLDAHRQGIARAVKVVQRQDPTALARSMILFEHEAAAAALLGRSPAFVRIFGYDTGDEPYLVMECVRWPTLAKALRAGPLSSTRAARLGIALLEALEIMHYHRMIHRDLKPSNLFVDDTAGDWRVKIADLGIWIRDADAGTPDALTPDDRFIHGTVPYMSPEQMNGNAIGPRSDLHTIASIIWECVTGELPFPVDEREDPATQVARRRIAVRIQPDRPAAMTPALYRALFQALALRPEDRPATARAFIEALRPAAADPQAPGAALAATENERAALAARLAALRPHLDPELTAQAQGIDRGLALLAAHLRRPETTERNARLLLAAVRADLVALAAAAEDPYRRADAADPTASTRQPASDATADASAHSDATADAIGATADASDARNATAGHGSASTAHATGKHGAAPASHATAGHGNEFAAHATSDAFPDRGSAPHAHATSNAIADPGFATPAHGTAAHGTASTAHATADAINAAPAPGNLPPTAAILAPTAPTAPLTTPPPPHDPIARYAITALAGAGTTARIYHAIHRTLGRPVALRVMHPEAITDLGADPATFFRARACAAARLTHPHILPIHDHDTGADGLPFVVEPLLQGETLLDRLKHRRVIDPPEVITLTRPLASALATAHAQGIMHLNIKPDRVTLQSIPGLGDHPMLFGFGFALDDLAPLHQTTTLYGTPAYMAPEQSQRQYTPAADIYALGTVIFRLITGLLPFWGPTIDAVLEARRTEPAPDLPPHTARGLDIPTPLRALIRDMLAIDPAARPDALTLTTRLATLR